MLFVYNFKFQICEYKNKIKGSRISEQPNSIRGLCVNFGRGKWSTANSIIVGTAEAQSIAIALEHIVPPRPLTHDLFATFAQAFNVILKEVYIYKFEDGVFYSELEFSDGERSMLDSRTSDAIAIAPSVKLRHLYFRGDCKGMRCRTGRHPVHPR